MFKDYYLIMGIGKDATPEEIEQAYKNTDAKLNVRGYISKEFHDIQEAYSILSKPELRVLYDRELEKFDASGDYDNYSIEDNKLADAISSIHNNIAGNPSGCGAKIGKGCLWAVVIVVVMMLQMCITAIMKQQGRNAVKNRYSYVMPQKTANSHVYQLL